MHVTAARIARIRPHLQNKVSSSFVVGNPSQHMGSAPKRAGTAADGVEYQQAMRAEICHDAAVRWPEDKCVNSAAAEGSLLLHGSDDGEHAVAHGGNWNVVAAKALETAMDGQTSVSHKYGASSDKEKQKLLMQRGWRVGGVVKTPQPGVAAVAAEERWWVSPDKRKFEGLSSAWREEMRLQQEVRGVVSCARRVYMYVHA